MNRNMKGDVLNELVFVVLFLGACMFGSRSSNFATKIATVCCVSYL